MWLLRPKHSCVDILHIFVPVIGSYCSINDTFWKHKYILEFTIVIASVIGKVSFLAFFFLEESQFEKGCIKHRLIKQKSVQREQGEKHLYQCLAGLLSLAIRDKYTIYFIFISNIVSYQWTSNILNTEPNKQFSLRGPFDSLLHKRCLTPPILHIVYLQVLESTTACVIE